MGLPPFGHKTSYAQYPNNKLEIGRVYPASKVEKINCVYDDDDAFFEALKADEDDVKDVNPRPDNWKLIREEQYGNHLVIEVRYPNCTHYEGRKILLYRHTTLGQLIITNKGLIDPHFSDNESFLSPFARFEPTEAGWNWAIALAEELG